MKLLDKNINKIINLISPKLNFCGTSLFIIPRVFQSFVINDKQEFLKYFSASPRADLLFKIIKLKKDVYKLKFLC